MDYKEFLEDYRDTLKRYCYAAADLPVKKNESGEYYLDCDLNSCLYVVGGHFDSDVVSNEILQGDFPFENVDKEGFWHFEFLLKYIPGDYEEPSYMEQLLVEASFQISFEDREAESKRESDGILPW